MQLILRCRARKRFRHVVLGRRGGGQVRIDRILPQAQPRENVRRHVQGVRRRGRDPGITPRGRKRQNRQLRRIVAVDHVVRDARMVRLLRQNAIQDLGRLFLVGVILIGGGRRTDQ